MIINIKYKDLRTHFHFIEVKNKNVMLCIPHHGFYKFSMVIYNSLYIVLLGYYNFIEIWKET